MNWYLFLWYDNAMAFLYFKLPCVGMRLIGRPIHMQLCGLYRSHVLYFHVSCHMYFLHSQQLHVQWLLLTYLSLSCVINGFGNFVRETDATVPLYIVDWLPSCLKLHTHSRRLYSFSILLFRSFVRHLNVQLVVFWRVWFVDGMQRLVR